MPGLLFEGCCFRLIMNVAPGCLTGSIRSSQDGGDLPLGTRPCASKALC